MLLESHSDCKGVPLPAVQLNVHINQQFANPFQEPCKNLLYNILSYKEESTHAPMNTVIRALTTEMICITT